MKNGKFSEVFKGEGKPTENRFSMCQNIIDRAEKDEFEIVVSAFTLAEVCKSKKATTENPSKLPAFLDHEYICKRFGRPT